MGFRLAGMTQDKSGGLREYFFAVIVFHDYMIGVVKGDEVFLFGTDVPVNFAAITRRHNMIVKRRHNQRWRVHLGKFGPERG